MDNIINVGISNCDKKLFEGQYPIPNGMLYNSYLVFDEKVALFETVEENGTEKWLSNIDKSLNGKIIDYLIISHMEPDHSANVKVILEKFPNIKIVASERAFVFLNQFYKINPDNDKIIKVSDNTTLSLGKYNFEFFTAPMVHWPEVIVSYEKTNKFLFSADAFGKFGTSNKTDNWTDEARRYYFNIVGKYGVQVQSLFKKISELEIDTIYPLHGPVLNNNIQKYIKTYDIWSKYEAENNGILIAFTSIYGNTKKVATLIYNNIKNKGYAVKIIDLSYTEISYAVSEAFRYSKLILASTTYDGGLFPIMSEFIEHLITKNFQNRKVGIIENGTWAPQAAKKMIAKLETMKNIKICENIVTLRSSQTGSNDTQIQNLTDEIML